MVNVDEETRIANSFYAESIMVFDLLTDIKSRVYPQDLKTTMEVSLICKALEHYGLALKCRAAGIEERF